MLNWMKSQLKKLRTGSEDLESNRDLGSLSRLLSESLSAISELQDAVFSQETMYFVVMNHSDTGVWAGFESESEFHKGEAGRADKGLVSEGEVRSCPDCWANLKPGTYTYAKVKV